MAQVYFHCCNDDRVLLDRCPTEIGDLTDACERASRLILTLVGTPSLEDWRKWTLHVSDDLGEELFVMPFAAVLGKPN